MKIGIIGVTGYSGGHLATEATSRGHHVIGVSRTAAARDDVESRTGSLFDAAAVETLAADSDVLLLAVPATSEAGTFVDALPAVLTACEKHDTRLGIVGGAGSLQVEPGGPALYDTPDFPDAFRAGSKAQGEALAALQASDTAADWFYVSPAGGYGRRNPGERTGTYRVGDDVLLTDADGVSALSGADLAVVFLDEIEQPAHHRVRFTAAY